MKIGDINITDHILNTEMRLSVLEKVFDYIVQNNYSLAKPSKQDLENFRSQALSDLQERYPNMGIQKK